MGFERMPGHIFVHGKKFIMNECNGVQEKSGF